MTVEEVLSLNCGLISKFHINEKHGKRKKKETLRQFFLRVQNLLDHPPAPLPFMDTPYFVAHTLSILESISLLFHYSVAIIFKVCTVKVPINYKSNPSLIEKRLLTHPSLLYLNKPKIVKYLSDYMCLVPYFTCSYTYYMYSCS